MKKPLKPAEHIKCETVYVEGMHCASCKLLIEKEFSKFKGVKRVNANTQTGEVLLETTPQTQVSISDLNNAVAEYGYEVFKSRQKNTLNIKQPRQYILPLFIAVTFVFAILNLHKVALTDVSQLQIGASYMSSFILGILAGISSCAALVGTLLASVTKSWTEKHGKSMQPQLLFLISRCIAFLVLGSALGLVGGIFSFSPTFTIILVLIVSLFMVAIGSQMLGVGHINTFPRIPKFAQLLKNMEKSHNKLSPVFLGILTFFLPCGITIVAQAQALTLGNPLTAGISMLAFALGTLPPLLLIGTISTKFYTNKRYASFFSYFAGFVAVLFGLFSINSQLNLLGLPSFNDLSHVLLDRSSEKQVAIVENKQLMQMEAKGFEYAPKEFTLKLNVPVRWEIYNSGAIGCANAVYAPGLYEEVIILKPGLNTFEFTPTKIGVYKISCSMGMVPPVYVTVK